MTEEWRDIPGFPLHMRKSRDGGYTVMIHTTVKYTDGSVASMALADWDDYCAFIDGHKGSIEEAHGELVVVEGKN